MNKSSILVIGACGQIGSELVLKLRSIYGNERVVASDIKDYTDESMKNGVFEILDATYKGAILNIIKKHNVSEVYLMAAMVSVTAEKYPHRAWDLNMNSLLYVLELAQEGYLKKVFWPSSIAVFGKTTPNINTPQVTITEPSTVYGISKLAGERWCEYYKTKYGIDVRSVRYPGIISWKTPPGGGTTDYAVEIYHKALEDGLYDCFLSESTRLPMMYMDDAIDATVNLMAADLPENFAAYNISATNFTPKEIAESIKKHIPDFKINYTPDFRQQIADSWPQNMDDSQAKKDWNWKHTFDLDKMTEVMLRNLKLLNESK
ncbi:NAD-dependent epimerase/dehydratase family protein [Aureibaculum conchae]|uniref:NAD-dependent epimerase/dehydratase family protein n=1 Tax=Aureibaculum sp. 2308TA14-22 TaxID=3108392 RepID=UPI003396391D